MQNILFHPWTPNRSTIAIGYVGSSHARSQRRTHSESQYIKVSPQIVFFKRLISDSFREKSNISIASSTASRLVCANAYFCFDDIIEQTNKLFSTASSRNSKKKMAKSVSASIRLYTLSQITRSNARFVHALLY